MRSYSSIHLLSLSLPLTLTLFLYIYIHSKFRLQHTLNYRGADKMKAKKKIGPKKLLLESNSLHSVCSIINNFLVAFFIFVVRYALKLCLYFNHHKFFASLYLLGSSLRKVTVASANCENVNEFTIA